MTTNFQAEAGTFRRVASTFMVACGCFLAVLAGSAARADLIVAEADGNFATTDVEATGWTATLSGGGWNDSVGSTDEFYGPDNAIDGVGGAPVGLGARNMSKNNTVTIELANNTGSAVALGMFLFDAAIDGNGDNPANVFSARYVGGGGLGASNVVFGDTGALPLVSPAGNYVDFGVHLADFVGAGMLDTTTLADGASATFEIISSNGTSNNYRLDNLAITSFVEPVPEPTAILLLASGILGAIVYLRRARRA